MLRSINICLSKKILQRNARLSASRKFSSKPDPTTEKKTGGNGKKPESSSGSGGIFSSVIPLFALSLVPLVYVIVKIEDEKVASSVETVIGIENLSYLYSVRAVVTSAIEKIAPSAEKKISSDEKNKDFMVNQKSKGEKALKIFADGGEKVDETEEKKVEKKDDAPTSLTVEYPIPTNRAEFEKSYVEDDVDNKASDNKITEKEEDNNEVDSAVVEVDTPSTTTTTDSDSTVVEIPEEEKIVNIIHEESEQKNEKINESISHDADSDKIETKFVVKNDNIIDIHALTKSELKAKQIQQDIVQEMLNEMTIQGIAVRKEIESTLLKG